MTQTDKTASPTPAYASQTAANQAPPTTIVLQANQPSVFQRFTSWLGWTGFLLCLVAILNYNTRLSDYFNTTSGLTEKFVSGDKYGADKVAIISVSGLIMEGDGFVKKQIDRVRSDSNIKAVVLRVDSPGGTVTGSDYMLHHLNKLRDEKKIPIVVSMGSVAASGGYYVAMAVGNQEKSIYAEPTTITGSIGVMIPHYDVSGLLDELHVKDDSIASHERKLMLNMTKPLTAEHRAIVQGTIDQMFGRFKEIIKEGRPVFRKDPEALDELATGEVFLADSAKKFGLVDEIGFEEDAIERALELANLDDSKTRVVRYERPSTLMDAVGYGSARASASSSWSSIDSLFDMTTPRAFYLYSTFPAIANSMRGE